MAPTERKRFQNLTLFAGEYIYRDDYETKAHSELSHKSAIHLMRSSVKVVLVVIVGLIGFLAVPFYEFFIMNQHPMPIPIYLPFVDHKTNSGYYINIAHQVTFGTVGINAALAIEIMNCLLKNSIYAAKESAIFSMDVLETLLKQDSTFSSNKKAEFKNVIVKIQDLDRFLIELCDVYYLKFFLQPLLLAYSIASSILCFYVVSELLFLLFHFELKNEAS